MPEYSNTTAAGATADDYAYIQLNLYGYTDEENAPYRIYFSNYSTTTGTTSSFGDYDIGRNVIYRFTVSLTGRWLQVHVNKWEDSFENDFTYTIPQ